MNNRAVVELLKAIKRKLDEQEIQLRMVRSMQYSSYATAKEFRKNHRRIEKGSSFYRFYEAKLALEDKDSKELKQFYAELAAHLKAVGKMLAAYEKPYLRYYSSQQRAEKRFVTADAHLKRLEQRLAYKESLNYITPEEKLQGQVNQLREKQYALNYRMLLAKADSTNERGACYKMTNEFVTQLQAAYYRCLDVEKRFYQHVSNIERMSAFYKRVYEIDKIAKGMNVLEASSRYLNDELRIQDVVKDAVFDNETAARVMEERRMLAEQRKLKKQEVRVERDSTRGSTSQSSRQDDDGVAIPLAGSPREVLLI